jgi:hypothetical protein
MIPPTPDPIRPTPAGRRHERYRTCRQGFACQLSVSVVPPDSRRGRIMIVTEEMRGEARRLYEGYFGVRVPKRAPRDLIADPWEEMGYLRQVGAGYRVKVQQKEWRETIGVVERATASNQALVTARRAEWAAMDLAARLARLNEDRAAIRKGSRAGRKCSQCDKPLDAQRATARYCSSTCRSRARRPLGGTSRVSR